MQSSPPDFGSSAWIIPGVRLRIPFSHGSLLDVHVHDHTSRQSHIRKTPHPQTATRLPALVRRSIVYPYTRHSSAILTRSELP
eukprot:3551133-Prymnesium_polylepis.1